MERAEPGIGYVILSQILASERHNFVITTNFDYLIEDSVRMYTATKPFTAGHETLAEFISSQTERPTIIKVHRDLFLHPFNDTDETEKLKKEWKKALMPILKNFNLLVVGYGGNDGSLMDYLKSINAEDRKAIYWCVRSENDINDKIKSLLDAKDYIVKIEGFDELMISLNNASDYNVFDNLDIPEKHTFVVAAKQRIVDLNEKRNQLLKNIREKKKPINKETKEIFSGVGTAKYIINAYSEKNEDIAESIYKDGLKQFPNDAYLNVFYALFLNDIRKNYEKAEEYYKKAIELKPNEAEFVGNYANFLSDVRKDYEKAEEYYKKAIELDTNDVDIINDYANFLTDIRMSYKAEYYYKKAITLEPNDSDIIADYANFLANIRMSYKAEYYYKMAIELDPDGVDIIIDYAFFLINIQNDYDKAEDYFKKAIRLEPNNAEVVMEYADFLVNFRKNYNGAEKYFNKAIELMPDDADFIGNYAHFLIIARKDFINAETKINQSFKLAAEDNLKLLVELWFYRYAHYKGYLDIAEKKLESLILKGVELIGWNLEPDIELAKENNHPNIKKLIEFADKITKP